MADQVQESVVHFLCVGMPPELRARLNDVLKEAVETTIPCDLEKLMEDQAHPPAFVICGAPPEGVSTVEVAQALRMQNQAAPIFLVVESTSKHDRKNLMKNGFSDVFFLPLDQQTLERTINEIVSAGKKTARAYRQVKLLDLQEDTKLDFDTYIYMPANKKHIKFSAAGDAIEKTRMEKLKSAKSAPTVEIAQDEMAKFYDYTAARLKAIGSNETMSETQRQEKMHGAVRELVSGLFNDAATGTDSGKQAIEDCQKIVKSFVTADTGKGGWYERFITSTGNNVDTYSHASNVCTYGALFAMAVGCKNVADVSLAGLLHDIGMAKVPYEIQSKDSTLWTPQEKELWEKHPEFAVDIIKERKMVVSELVHKIILQHHENFNGTGFPKRLIGDRICQEAQILALADRFDELTKIVPGKAAFSPVEAINMLYKTAMTNASQQFIDPALFKRILTLFPGEKAAA